MKKLLFFLVSLCFNVSFAQTGETCSDAVSLDTGTVTLTPGIPPKWYSFANTSVSTREVTVNAGEFGENVKTYVNCNSTPTTFDSEKTFVMSPNEKIFLTHSDGLVDFKITSIAVEAGTLCSDPIFMDLDSPTSIEKNNWYSYTNASDTAQYLFINSSNSFSDIYLNFTCPGALTFNGPSINRVSLLPNEQVYFAFELPSTVTLTLENADLEGKYCESGIALSEGLNTKNSFQSKWYKYTNTTTDTLALTYNRDTDNISYHYKDCKDLAVRASKSAKHNTLVLPSQTIYSYFIGDADINLEVEVYTGSISCLSPKKIELEGIHRAFNVEANDQYFFYKNESSSPEKVTINNCELTDISTRLWIYFDGCNGSEVDLNDGFCGSQAQLTFDLPAGDEIVIRWQFIGFEKCNFDWRLAKEKLTSLSNTENTLAISLFPSPASDVLNLSKTVDEITLMTLDGLEVAKSTNTDFITLNKIKSGIYIAKTTKGIRTSLQKVIIR